MGQDVKRVHLSIFSVKYCPFAGFPRWESLFSCVVEMLKYIHNQVFVLISYHPSLPLR